MRTIFGSVFVLLALAGAAVQYNDPDMPIWAGTYLAGAVLGVLFVIGRMPRLLALAYAAATTAWAAWLAYRIFAHHSFFADPNEQMLGLSEETREMLGLLILATLTMGMVAAGRRRPKGTKARA